MNTDKNAMALYVRVVEAGSFSKAAAREGVPVSTVSRKIAELEKALGVRLLERSTRQLRMTEIGQGYFESCRRGLTEFEAADSLVTQRQAEISGRLRISIPPSMSDLAVVPLVSAFQQRYPKVTVHCLVTERYIDYIADGIDLSIRGGQPSNRDSSVVASTVAVQRPRLLASPDYLARIEPVTRPEDVASHVQLAFARWERPLAWTLSREHESVRIEPEPRLVINDYAGVLQGLVGGRGISELPSFLCQAALQQGRLVELLPEWQFASAKLSVAFPSNRNLSPLVRAFKDFCVSYFEAHPLA
ncbi:LysR substrate-binding domain-containing protein [Variovorax sp. LjRoot290]|uniref:LysR family transcriptional regulator n=1 Tax=unclassified Variovorax TaxID=663243 RepID=UPI003ECFA7A9